MHYAVQTAPFNAFRDLEVKHLAHKHPLLLLMPGDKRPGVPKPGGVWVDDARWRTHPLMDAKLLEGVKQLPAVNMGLRLGMHPALPTGEFLAFLDLDVINPMLKAAVIPLVMKAAGGEARAFWRNGNPAKAGGVFLRVKMKNAGAVLKKRELVFGGPDREKIELLAEGQQVAIGGPHPSGSLYVFLYPANRLPHCPVSEIICLEEAELDALWSELGAAAAEAGCAVVSRTGGSGLAGTGHADFVDLSEADARILQGALAEVRNDFERGTWVQIVKTYRAVCEDALGLEQVREDLLAFDERWPGGSDGGAALDAVMAETDRPVSFGLRQFVEALAERLPDNKAEVVRRMARRALAQDKFSDSPFDPGAVAATAARAIEDATPEWVREMNERYALLGGEGSSASMCLLVFEDGGWRLEDIHKARRLFANDFVQVGTNSKGGAITQNRLDAWVSHPARRTYPRGIAFLPQEAPGAEVHGQFNTWEGWQVQPQPGSCDTVLRHIREVLAAGDPAWEAYLLDWLALRFQKPGGTMGTALVLLGPQGNGKSWLGVLLKRLAGVACAIAARGDYIVGRFTVHLRDINILIAEEAVFARDPQVRSRLKALITDGTMVVEGKGLPAQEVRNHIGLVMLTNEEHGAPAEAGDRRFAVVRTGAKRDPAYYRDLWNVGLKEAGAFLHFLLNRDISSFSVADFPRSKARAQQIVAGLRGPDGFLWELLAAASWPKGTRPDGFGSDPFRDWRKAHINVPKAALASALADYMRVHERGRIVPAQEIKLRVEAAGAQTKRPLVDGKQMWCWTFPPLNLAREAFADALGLGVGVDAFDSEEEDDAALDAEPPPDEDEI